MLQRILAIIAKEDAYKIFTSHIRPNIFEAIGTIQDPTNPMEVQAVLVHFFTHVMQMNDPSSFFSTEARRMLGIVDSIFREIKGEPIIPIVPPFRRERDLNDEIVDIYMESLACFISGKDEPVLREHYQYLDR